MEEPQKSIVKSISFFLNDIAFLEQFDKNNLSNANRLAIHKLRNQHRNQQRERYLVIFAFGLLLLALSTFITIITFSAIILAIGIVYIGYAVGLAVVGLVRK